ncbi:glycosyl transferase family 1, partial [Novosphingobium bradum]
PLAGVPGLSGVLAMSDSTGMFQHAIGVVPDRRHGYCLDDNVRALMLMNVAQGLSRSERTRWSGTYASFIQHAWNPEARRFRNFMRFERTWCEEVGSADSNGRALWALGHTVENAPDPDIRRWAQVWFDEVWPALDELDWPRARAFVMLGAAAMLRAQPGHEGARVLLAHGGAWLHDLLDQGRRPGWTWFEPRLGYDNARLSQALIEGGLVLDRPDWTCAGLESLAWLAGRQTAAAGHFRPVGSESFAARPSFVAPGGSPAGLLPDAVLPFDQQPLEAQAAVEAARGAWEASGEQCWLDHALSAHRWFFGGNDRGVVLADMATGRSRDGVTPRGVNENCGAESILAFQLAHYSMLALWGAARAAPRSGDFVEPGPRSVGQPLANP